MAHMLADAAKKRCRFKPRPAWRVIGDLVSRLIMEKKMETTIGFWVKGLGSWGLGK